MAMALLNPTNGKFVKFDDCQHATGMMVEAKGTGYAAALAKPGNYPRNGILAGWLDQANRQMAAAGDRSIRWYFAEPEAAEEAEELFRNDRALRNRINVEVLKWP